MSADGSIGSKIAFLRELGLADPLEMAEKNRAIMTNTFDKIGMVVFFSTTPCERFSSRTRSALLTVNSMHGSFAILLSRFLSQIDLKENRIHRGC